MSTSGSIVAQVRDRYASADKGVVCMVVLLCAGGVLAVYSAIAFLAEARMGGSSERFLLRHVLRVGLALGAIGIVSLLDYRKLARFARPALIGALGLLVLVQLVGVASGGAQRWLQVGPVGFQPSDLAKVALLFYVAVLLARKQDYIKSFGRAFGPIFSWILLTVLLIGIENLSAAALVLAAAVLVCFVGRVSVLHLSGVVLLGVLLGGLLLLSSPTRAARVEAYLGAKIFPNTEAEQVFSARAEGYQAEQARIAFALGGVLGVGPGKSVQRDFLPAPYNDFIFAIIAEEYGMVGAFLVLAAFMVILFRGFMRIARDAVDPLGLFLAVGFTTMIALYGFIHAGVSCGLFPVTGLPLPFVSYGGTSMVTMGFMIGILLSISRHTKTS